MGRMDQKIVLITGGAGGIGSETARAVVAEGGRVVLGDVAVDQARRVAAELGPAALAVALDVTDENHWRAAVASAEEAFGGLHALVNNAGIASYGPLEHLDLAEFNRIIGVNQVGPFLGMKSAIPALRRAGGGSIVNVSSLAGLVGLPQACAYTASKWAVRGMTKTAASELGGDGIRVNSVHPGVIDTPLADAQRELIDAIIPQLPAGRLGRAREIADLVLFLVSDESSYCTGAEFAADGGWSAS